MDRLSPELLRASARPTASGTNRRHIRLCVSRKPLTFPRDHLGIPMAFSCGRARGFSTESGARRAEHCFELFVICSAIRCAKGHHLAQMISRMIVARMMPSFAFTNESDNVIAMHHKVSGKKLGFSRCTENMHRTCIGRCRSDACFTLH
jgi:hypothetical protein